MMLHGGHASQLARGLMLAHELEHARDCLLNGEPDSKVLSESWLMGELNAHAKVMLVLNEWTQGGWKKIVSASRERREAMTASRGHRPESSVFGQLPEDREAFAKQFGVLDDVTIGLLFFQLDVDANLLNINVQMQRYGRPEAEAMGHYLEVLHALYAQNLGIIQRND
jgi:hypothetical protein